MHFVDIYKIYIVVPKLRIPKFDHYINTSGISFMRSGKPKAKHDIYYQCSPIRDYKNNIVAIKLTTVEPEAIPADSYFIKITQLKDYKSVLAIQGLENAQLP